MINPYKFDPSDPNIFSIDTPPPTVSGHLHMGHVFSYCHADFIARFQRMNGKNVFYPIGFDDNGLPTERLVEKITGIKVGFNFNEKSKEILKELTGKNYDGVCSKMDFVEICKVVVNDAEIEFEKLFKSINLSVDWDYKYQSISENSAKIAQTAFVNLFNKGLIYQKNAPVYWCTADKTATANAEIEDKEMTGLQIEFNFHTEDNTPLRVMTTRPEMLPACVALLFNPEDERYKHLLSTNSNAEITHAIVPISNHKVPILPDQDVKIDKGTGLVMCCTYGDWQDVIWAKRHNLKERIIISEDGKIYFESEFLKVEDARKRMIELLEKEGLLLSKKETIREVKCAERSGKPLEIIPTKQWYVRVLPFKNILLEMSRLVKFRPESMRIKLENWINGLSQDWCISRNRFFGIDIPVDDPHKNLVLDTWFTSGLSPHLSTILHENLTNGEIDFAKNSMTPMSLRPQAHEIIRTWTFVTLVQSYLNLATEITDEASEIDIHSSDNPLEFNEKDYIVVKSGDKFLKCHRPNESHLPWKNVMLSGWCLASDKTKMSKSKGNIVTPTGLIGDFGADSVRYWAGSSTLGADTAYNEGQIKVGQKLVTKLKNASKLCLQTIEKSDILSKTHEDIFVSVSEIKNPIDKVMIQKITQTFEDYKGFMQEYEYSKALDIIEKFFWNDFCDNYLELVKTRSYGLLAQIYEGINLSDNEKNIISEGQNSASTTMYICICLILSMFAVFLPNICDEIYKESKLREKTNKESIHEIGFFSLILIKSEKNDIDFAKYNAIIEILNAARKAKSESSVSIKTKLTGLEIPQEIANLFGKNLQDLSEIKDLLNAINCDEINTNNGTEINVLLT